MIVKTMLRSAKPLNMLVFFTVLGQVMCASILYYCERGSFDSTLVSTCCPLGGQGGRRPHTLPTTSAGDLAQDFVL